MSGNPAEGSQAPLDWSRSTSAQQESSTSETNSEERDLPTVSSQATRRRQYMFINQPGDRRSSNEAIRVHVMRQSHRARRQLLGLQQSAHEDRHDQITILQTTIRPDSQTQSSNISAGADLNNNEAGTDTTTADNSATVNTQSLDNLRLFGRQYTPTLSPIDRTILELCQNNIAALSAFLSLVVLQVPGTGTSNPQIRSAELESQALLTVRSALATTPTMDQDDIALTIALLSRLERHRNNDEVASFHEAALQQMIQDLGGTEALAERNPALANVLRSLGLWQGQAS